MVTGNGCEMELVFERLLEGGVYTVVPFDRFTKSPSYNIVIKYLIE